MKIGKLQGEQMKSMMRYFIATSLAILAVLVLSGNSDAYYLDSPHNESNGIYCHNCHNSSAWYWVGSKDPNDPDNIDKTTRNAVCLNCHGNKVLRDALRPQGDIIYPPGYVEGPYSPTHASSCESESHGVWTTECIDCHSPHFQGQLDWDQEDSSRLFIATGDFTSDPVASGSNTTITFTGLVAKAGFTDTFLWTSKGGTVGNSNADSWFATDGTRGLLLVPDTSLPQTFEIIDVTGNVMTVKGTMTGTLNNLIFGVIYGQAIRSFIVDANGNGFRGIKFFNPRQEADTYGGLVDNTPGTTAPLGLCQVCHNKTKYWRTDGAIKNGTHNPADATCNTCHDAHFCGGDVFHSSFITDDVEAPGGNGRLCSSCHPLYTLSPEIAHVGGCDACHVPLSEPAINSNPMPSGQPDSDTGNPTANLTDTAVAPYTQYNFTGVIGTDTNRLSHGAFTIADAGAGFNSIRCGECHNAKPDALRNGTHGGHPVEFGTTPACLVCHTGSTDLKDLHGDGITATCSMCHTVGPPIQPSRDNEQAGPAANGVDGDAHLADGTAEAGIWTAITCITCHNATGYGLAVIHHDNKTDGVVSGGLTDNGTICGKCHNVSGYQGDHSGSVNIATNCVECHDVSKGSPTGITIDNIPGNKIHDNCGSCHAINGSNVVVLVDPATSQLVTAMPDGGDAGGTLVGAVMAANNCESCHVGWIFENHSHLNHTVLFDPATDLYIGQPCSNSGCHAGEVEDWNAIITRHGNYTLNGPSPCDTCHNATRNTSESGLFSVGLTIPQIISNGGTVNCLDCHIDEGGGGVGH